MVSLTVVRTSMETQLRDKWKKCPVSRLVTRKGICQPSLNLRKNKKRSDFPQHTADYIARYGSWPFGAHEETNRVIQRSTGERRMKEREVVISEFVKWKEIGITVVGKVASFGNNKNGDFIELSPVLYRANDKAKWTRYARLAVGLTTDLQRKGKREDMAAIVYIKYGGRRPSPSGSPQKLFKGFYVTKKEALKFSKNAPAKSDPLNPPPAAWGTA